MITARARASLALAGLAALVAAALLGWRSGSSDEPKKAVVTEDAAPVRLARLLPLRRALSGGDEAGAAALFSGNEKGAIDEIRRLWQAEAAMRRGELAGADRMLQRLPSPSRRPAVEIARARLSAVSRREADAAISYDRAVRLGPSQDGLWLEAGEVLGALGYEKRSLDYLERCAKLGSREPEVYFRLAEEAAIAHHETDAEALFATGWALRPMERSNLFDSSALWWFLSRSHGYALLSLETSQEPVVARAAIARSEVRFPSGADVRTCGDTLRVRIGSSSLPASGGSELAPEGAVAEDAGAPQRQEEAEALARLPELVKSASSPSALGDPALRTRILAALSALDRDRRSDDVVALTNGLVSNLDRVPGHLVRSRAAALRRLGRLDEERKLLLGYASVAVKAERRDPATLLQLSESFVSLGEYDIATRLVGRAFSQLPFDPPGDRVLRIALEKRLAQSFEVLDSPEFTIRFPKDADAKASRYIEDILKRERKRLEKWVPGATKKIAVDLLPVDDFQHVFAGDASIVGLWDGKVRLPLAGLRLYMPELVAIMTHELLHGLLAEATGDRAPKWFHEGLAQHVEMVRFGANPFADYAVKGRILSLATVDQVLETFPDPELIQQAYDQAAWTLHYIEKIGGEAAIRKMVAEFAAGANSEEVVQRVLGRSMAQLDADLSAWWLGPAPKIWTSEIVRYDAPEPTIRPKDPAGMRGIPSGMRERGFPPVGSEDDPGDDDQ